MPKPNLKGVKQYTPAEYKERKKATPAEKRERKRPKDIVRRTVIASVSIPPELKLRAARDLGNGSFSKAVKLTLVEALRRLDENRQILGDE